MSQGPLSTDAQMHLDQIKAETLDAARTRAKEKRHSKGYRTARENLLDLVDDSSFVESCQLAVAAQRDRRDPPPLRVDTAADGVTTGPAPITSPIPP